MTCWFIPVGIEEVITITSSGHSVNRFQDFKKYDITFDVIIATWQCKELVQPRKTEECTVPLSVLLELK